MLLLEPTGREIGLHQYLCELDIWLATTMLMLGNEIGMVDNVWLAWEHKYFANFNGKHLDV